MKFIGTYDPRKEEMVSILKPSGKVDVKLDPKLDKKTLIKIYKQMVLSRMTDDRAFKLQRRGMLGTFAQATGQEAAQVGAMLATSNKEWIVPAFRETAALIAKELPLENFFMYYMGNEMGNHTPDNINFLPVSIPVGSQTLHAVGIAWGMQLKKEKAAALCFFGDGATSEGDFHEAMNFAGVLNAPVIFICQNNQYAISLPEKEQTASKTIAQKACAYGFDGVLVDGNDVFAMYAVVKEAIEKAKKDEGPTLIEAYTYRLGPHTTADDPTLYRADKEVASWKDKDPIMRLRNYLTKKKIWSKKFEEDTIKEAEEQIAAAIKKAEQMKAQPKDLFEWNYAEMPPELQEQYEYLQQFLGEQQ